MAHAVLTELDNQKLSSDDMALIKSMVPCIS